MWWKEFFEGLRLGIEAQTYDSGYSGGWGRKGDKFEATLSNLIKSGLKIKRQKQGYVRSAVAERLFGKFRACVCLKGSGKGRGSHAL